MKQLIASLDAERPVLIAGPTASGKSALAMAVAEQGGVIINADALQVFSGWRVLTARPSAADEAAFPHALYGHVSNKVHYHYSVGHWLRDIAPLLGGARPIIVGGTGLNFTALTEGLAEIPETPADVRARADAADPAQLLAALDAATAARIDTANPARIRRAWEVLETTGRGLTDWQAATPPPLLPLQQVQPIVLNAAPEWLTPRIEQRFDIMLKSGALEEVRAQLPTWVPNRPSSRAIGAAELVAYLNGQMTLDAARERAVILSRQYAKRQRTWFRARMSGWKQLDAESTA